MAKNMKNTKKITVFLMDFEKHDELEVGLRRVNYELCLKYGPIVVFVG